MEVVHIECRQSGRNGVRHDAGQHRSQRQLGAFLGALVVLSRGDAGFGLAHHGTGSFNRGRRRRLLRRSVALVVPQRDSRSVAALARAVSRFLRPLQRSPCGCEGVDRAVVVLAAR